MAVWYRVGTVSVTQGSPTVTGNGTVFTSVVREGDMFTVDENIFYEIAAVVSDTQLTLTKNYAQASASNVSYAIVPLSPRRHLASDLGTRVDDLIVRYREKLDAVIVTADEINALDNVTSNVQTQLNSKVTGPASAVDGNLPVFNGTTGKVIKDTGLTPTIIVKDARREAVEAASGGAMTVLYDDLNQPSYMVIIPKFNVEDIDATYGTGVHPAFIVNGEQKPEIFIGAYQAKIYDNRACSIPHVDPTVSINFDNSKAACTNKGAGWHLMTNWEWAAVALWCLKNGFQPRGNTNYGRAYETAYKYETGSRIDNLAPGSAGTGRTLTGSGPASWRHNNTFNGISDLVGNVWEWQDGLKIVDGMIYMPTDNNYNLAETSWLSAGIGIDNVSGVPVFTTNVTNKTDASINKAWKDLTKKEGDTFEDSVLKMLMQAAIIPITIGGGSYISYIAAPNGRFYVNTSGERIARRGGHWYDAANAGLFALTLNRPRSYVYPTIGFRPAFIG